MNLSNQQDFINECKKLKPDTSYKDFYIKYIKSNNLPYGKLDQNNINNYKFGYLYTFNYNPINKDILSYYDMQPIVFFINRPKLCENTKNTIVKGININFIPVYIRTYVLAVFREMYNSAYEKEKLFDIVNSSKSTIENGRWKELIDYLLKNTIIKSNYEFAIRTYCISNKNMKKFKAIDYNDWKTAATLNEKLITGKSIGDIYKLYWQYKAKKK